MGHDVKELYRTALEQRGSIYELVSDFDRAQEDYQTIIRTHDDPKIKIHAMLGISKVDIKRGSFNAALRRTEKALALAKLHRYTFGHIRCLNIKTQVMVRLGNYSEALNIACSAQRFISNRTSRKKPRFPSAFEHEKARIASLIALVHCYQNSYTKAIPLLTQAIAIFKKQNDIWNVALALTNLGNAYNESGQVPEALRCYDESLKIKEKIGDRYGISNILHNLSRAYSLQGNHSRALKCAQQALTISMAIHDQSGEAGCLLAIGIHYRNLGMINKALASCQKALHMSTRLNEPYLRVASMINIFGLFLALGRYAQSRKLAAKMQKEARALGNPYLIVEALNVQADLYQQQNEPDKAIALLKESITISREQALAPEEITTLCLTARITINYKKDYATAKRLLTRSASLFDKHGNPDVLRFYLPAQIEYHIATSQYRRAQEIAQHLLTTVQNMDYGFIEPVAHYYMAWILLCSGKNPGYHKRKAQKLAKQAGMIPLLRKIAVLN
jgi:tetratricopeptide (TPR) repeat protein